MAGHSKWANIQHRKGRQDAKRGKLWTKIIREITVAARAGGADPDSNPRLRMAWDKGMAANMPKENIQRAVQRGNALQAVLRQRRRRQAAVAQPAAGLGNGEFV